MASAIDIFTALSGALHADPAELRAKASGALDELIAGQYTRVVLFGAGNLGCRLADGLRSHGVQPVAFSDNNASLWGTTVAGLKVYSPAEAVERFADNSVFVISIWRWPASDTLGQRKAQLLSLGCQRVCGVFPIFWKYPDVFLPNYCLDHPHLVVEAHVEVETALELFTDGPSRLEYARQVLWRIDPETYDLDSIALETEYFPEDLFILNDHEVFVDVGGFDGDTSRVFMEKCQESFDHVHIIEADPLNFVRLEEWRLGLASPLRAKVSSYNLAAGSQRGSVSFMANASVGSCISDAGTVSVQCDRLDSILSDVRPTIIKMDIEGAEREALQGCGRLIKDCQPILAICLYHRQSDMWKIPNWLATHFSGYRFFLKSHSLDGWDLVLYGVPLARCIR